MASSTPISKATAERHQRILLELLKQPGNEVCADCRTRNPRWASWNLGIFICVKCAGIHRKLGTHITKVKSLTMDSWTKEQVQRMQQCGNRKSNELYNPNDAKHPPPTDLEESERDSQLERFIRRKYESKRYMDPHAKTHSTSSATTSVSSDLSFNMLPRTARSSSSSVHHPSPSAQSFLFAQSPSLTCSSKASIQSHSRGNSVTASIHRPSASRVISIQPTPAGAQSHPVSQDNPMTSPRLAPSPPFRASTAPLPRDGHVVGQNLPSVPIVPSLYSSLDRDIFQTNLSIKQGNQSPCRPDRPSLDIHLRPSQTLSHVHPPPRTDGIWGDLMQLAEPSPRINPSSSTASYGSFPTSDQSASIDTTVAFKPPHSTRLVGMGSLENGMGKLMQGMTLRTPEIDGSHQLAPTNPFLRQNPQPATRLQTISDTLHFHSVNNPAGSFNASDHSMNPFINNQNTYLMNQQALSSSAPFVHSPGLNTKVPTNPSRNPFMSTNLQGINGNLGGFGRYYTSNH